MNIYDIPLGTHYTEEETTFAVESQTPARLCLWSEKGEPLVAPDVHQIGNVYYAQVHIPPLTRYMWRVEGRLLLDPRALEVKDNLGVVVPSPPLSQHPHIPWEKTIIYEAHLKGLTAYDGGTYCDLIPRLSYLKSLGITALELLPIQEFDTDCPWVNPFTGKGNTNYWGYNTKAFFAPHAAYSRGEPLKEFCTLVDAIHSAGLELLLDIVFNHTAEGNEKGPTISFKGFNPSFYLLTKDGYYIDYSGCGNTVSQVAGDFILDALRYWHSIGVDGFRFDLAQALRRGPEILPYSTIERIATDPYLADAKLIAEPWDCGGYGLGSFPRPWREWNDKFRDAVRRFWRGDAKVSSELATRLCGSQDIMSLDHTINFVTCHDGFTLWDLVSYNTKHNLANGEDNRDGSDNNFSYNNGAEGSTEDPKILFARTTCARSMMATTILARGVPMILGGDEYLRSQGGNNNAYCQDNETSWFNWKEASNPMVDFVRTCISIRRLIDYNAPVHWYNPDGTYPDWKKLSRYLGFTLGRFFFSLNADRHDMLVLLPHTEGTWRLLLDTSGAPTGTLPNQRNLVVPQGAMVVLVYD